MKNVLIRIFESDSWIWTIWNYDVLKSSILYFSDDVIIMISNWPYRARILILIWAQNLVLDRKENLFYFFPVKYESLGKSGIKYFRKIIFRYVIIQGISWSFLISIFIKIRSCQDLSDDINYMTASMKGSRRNSYVPMLPCIPIGEKKKRYPDVVQEWKNFIIVCFCSKYNTWNLSLSSSSTICDSLKNRERLMSFRIINLRDYK